MHGICQKILKDFTVLHPNYYKIKIHKVKNYVTVTLNVAVFDFKNLNVFVYLSQRYQANLVGYP
jgi:hypothetical protein